MKRTLVGILLLLTAVGGFSLELTNVPCGTWLELRATANEDYHFVRWSDGVTDSVRRVEVLADETYIAYFAANCKDYANLPVVALYNWLLMLDVRSVQEMGYYFEEKDVTWYRVQGEIDDMQTDALHDDVQCGSGYYLTLDSSLIGTGDYYAVLDVSSNPSGMLCTGLMRSVVIHYTKPASVKRAMPQLAPTAVSKGGEMKLSGLLPDVPATVAWYDANGRLLGSFVTTGETSCPMQAAGTTGCFQVVVTADGESYALRYIVL